MNKLLLLAGVLLSLAYSSYGQDSEKSKKSYGILFMSGGRYDNLRRCAATSAGTKGGPIADIMLVTRKTISDKYALTFNLPVMRPILFGLAFKMLQFEPEFILEMNKHLSDRVDLVAGPGVGVSFHYGPDYKSELKDPDNSFFAIGPFFSWQTGIAFKRDGIAKSTVGLKAFYTPLFAKDRNVGTVLGGALFYKFMF
ncbi:MAG: hypothetical protein AB9846_06620 [Tenuifilaceae bacterium]